MSPRLLIVAGESSGEIYGSLLAPYFNKDFELIGIGGKHMAQAGIKLVGEITHSLGVFEVLGQLKKLKRNMEIATRALKEVQGVILIDYPDFNIPLAKKAKELGKRVLYYVSPQIWAWRKGRINTIKEVIDYMAVVLPFEEAIYKKAGIPVKFVGHPMLEAMMKELNINKIEDFKLQDKKVLRDKFDINQKTVITLMPGSRPGEIKRKMPLMLKLMKYFDCETTHFIIPKAPNIDFSETILKQITSSGNVTIFNEQSFTALAMSDVAVITSGTSTLQAALLKIPMAVIYRMNPLSYLIGRTIIKGVKHIALPNVIADFMNIGDIRVKEFIQKLDSRKIAKEINLLLYDNNYRENIINFLDNIRRHFITKEASREVAEICRQLF
ncbi:MAG TPA: lipid-A-disaccharide synthase [Thermodesulfovibrio thiophilus]|nr:lipid-A-disaccharide synthase [Thermodesulfovibrio thiophilus]